MESQKCVEIGIPVLVELEGVKKEITVVDADMANWTQGLISVETPIAQAILGAGIGSQFTVQLPNRTMNCSVLAFA